MKLFLGLVLFTALIVELEAYQFYVGGKDGWVVTPSENYNQWAGKLRFQVNDTLFFRYTKGTDSVLVVNQSDYDKCNTHNPIIKMDSGDSVFKFNRSGPFFFTSGIQDHCNKGQKIITFVLAVRSKSPPGSPAPIAQAPAPETGYVPPSPAPGPIAPGPGSSFAPTAPSPLLSPGGTPPASSSATSPQMAPSPLLSPGGTPPASSSATSPPTAPSPLSPPGGTPGSSSATSPPTAPSPLSPPGGTSGSSSATSPPPPSAGEVVTPSVIVLISGVSFLLNLIAAP